MLQDNLRELIDAGFSGIWIQSQEPDEAISEIRSLANREGWIIAGQDEAGNLMTEPSEDFQPYAAVAGFNAMTSDDSTPNTLLILPNFGSYLQDAATRQMVFKAIQTGKKNKRHIIIVAPVATIPVELEKVITVIDHDLPTRQQILGIAHGIATGNELPQGAELDRLLDAAAGLTRYEAEGAFSLCLVRHGRIDPETVFDLKAKAIENSGLATIWKGTETVDGIGGLSQVKQRLAMAGKVTGPWKPKGMILVGQPGTGKSHVAKAAGKILGRPVVSASLSRLKGQYVGETGKATRRVVALIKLSAPV